MPSSSTTSRIPPAEWEERKDRIIDLYMNQNIPLKGDNGLMNILEREGFSASRSQYETQLRGWGLRKYMSNTEWSEYFSENHESPQRGGTRELCLSGKQLPTSRIKTAQRRHRRREKQAKKTLKSNNPHASLRSTSLPILILEDRPISGKQDASRSTNTQSLELGREVDVRSTEVVDISRADSNTLHLENFITSTARSQASNDLNFIPTMFSENSLDVEYSDFPPNELMNTNMTTPRSLEFNPHIFDTPDTERALTPCHLLPCLSTLDQINITANLPQRRLGINPLPSIEIVRIVCQGITNNDISPSGYYSGTNVAHSNIAWQFMADITTPNPDILSLRVPHEYPSNHTFLQILTTLVSDELFLSEDEGQLSIPSNHSTIEGRFLSRLIMSFANGCAGLRDIPPGDILRFLNKRPDIQSSVFQYLRSSSSCAAKSFAENCFQAALESDDVSAAKLLLNLGYVDMNDTVCLYEGFRYTPFQKAAMKKSFGIVKLLLDLGADVKKSFSPGTTSVISYMLLKCDAETTMSSEFLSLINEILQAGAILELDEFKTGMRFSDSRLAYILIERAQFQTLQNLLGGKKETLQNSLWDEKETLLQVIMSYFQEANAITLLRLCIKRFQDSRCFDQLILEFEEAFAVAAEKGYMEIMRFLLPDVTCFTKSFPIAVRKGNEEVIDLILAKASSFEELVNMETFEAALASGNQKVICFLEDNNIFDEILESNRLGSIVKIAIDVGNSTYAHKLLDLHLGIIPLERTSLSAALEAAIANDHDDIAHILLSLGAQVHRCPSPVGTALSIAIMKRKLDLVRMMLECDTVRNIFSSINMINATHPCKLIDALIQCDDDSIVQQIDASRQSCPEELPLLSTNVSCPEPP
ncbi:hypothetical protein F5B19DRAFT_131367 [Rostrohypoxylon terebratum]|nr:hypothetical protein F5B19DRAFT_131367 [Rostrohypoxylon terebratum]